MKCLKPVKVLHNGCDKADIKLNVGSLSDPVDQVDWDCNGQLTDDGLVIPGTECQKKCLSGEFWSGNKSTKRCDCKKTCVWKLQTSTCKPAKTTCNINSWVLAMMKGGSANSMEGITCIDPINGEAVPALGDYSDGTVCADRCPEGFKHNDPTVNPTIWHDSISCKCSGSGPTRCQWSGYRLNRCVPDS